MSVALGQWAPEEMSVAEQLASLSDAERKQIELAMSDDQKRALRWDWDFWARPDQKAPPDFSVWLVLWGRGVGKLLDLDTMIPTPSGWRLLRHLALGDEVFDETGQPCRITAVYDDMPERAWNLEFSDHTSLVAGGEHQWVTWTHYERKAYNRSEYEARDGLPENWPQWRSGRYSDPGATRRCMGPQVRTTDEIVDTLHYGSRGDRNHSIPVAAPLVLPDVDLPIDPYLFGYWLGDGSSAGASITVSDEDAEESLGRFEVAGYTVGEPRRRSPEAQCATYSVGNLPENRDPLTGRILANGSLFSTLRLLDLLDNKFIPDSYLWASERQRLALLRGLMDSDGCVANSLVEFTSTNQELAEGVVHLARSLGAKPTIAKGRATLYGVDHGPKWRVMWRPNFHNPFLLRRKATAVRPLGRQVSRSFHRMIVSATPVPVRPMRCLTVDSPNSLFLAGEGMIPTHNTKTGAEWVRGHAPRHAEGLLIGANPRDARDLMIEGPSGIITISPPWEKPVYEPTKLLLRWPNGAVAHVRSAEDPEGIRGLSVEWAWVDELGKHRFAQETWDQRALALREGTHPQTVVTSTPTPTTLIKKLASGDGHGIVVAPRVSTYRNAANLAPDFFRTLLDQYEGSRFGRQELHAEILSDIKGALWSWEMIEKARWKGEWIDSPAGKVPDLRAIKRKVVGVDPSGSTTGDEWGIIVAGSDRGRPPCGYVLADRSQRGSPEDCARAAVRAYYDFNCDEMVAESNFGGEMVGRMIFNVPAEGVYPAGSSVRFKSVRAGKGQSKYERAVPVVGFYEQNVRGFRRVYHVGVFPELEQQMTEWVPPEQADGVEVFKSSWSPDRVDAAVYCLLELLVMNARRAGRAEGDVLRSASIG